MDLSAVKAFRFSLAKQSYTSKDSILYALGLGFGERPTDPSHLQFVYEQNLKSVPSMCAVLAHPGFWVSAPTLKINWQTLLHGEQSFEILQTLPPAGNVRAEYEILAVEDRGSGKGSVLHMVKRLYDVESGVQIASLTSLYLLRGDDGQGSFGIAPSPLNALPDRSPNQIVNIRTLPQSALVYRLSGDLNPIHADPVAAKRAGFPGPILHGLCSMGIAVRGLIESVAEGEPERLAAVAVRFSQPVMPGETISLEIFDAADGIRFRARALERNVVVLDRGSAVLRA
jgi:acyl dehydratase